MRLWLRRAGLFLLCAVCLYGSVLSLCSCGTGWLFLFGDREVGASTQTTTASTPPLWMFLVFPLCPIGFWLYLKIARDGNWD